MITDAHNYSFFGQKVGLIKQSLEREIKFHGRKLDFKEK